MSGVPVSTEYGTLTHRLLDGQMFHLGKTWCGRRAFLVPPEPADRLCPKCYPASAVIQVSRTPGE